MTPGAFTLMTGDYCDQTCMSGGAAGVPLLTRWSG
jgi:hypothetical protein